MQKSLDDQKEKILDLFQVQHPDLYSQLIGSPKNTYGSSNVIVAVTHEGTGGGNLWQTETK